jgi:hypothetical protein
MNELSRKPRRIVEAVWFEGEIGPVRATELVAVADDRWGSLRDRLTDGHLGKVDGLIAKCMQCGGNVFISTRRIKNVRLPFFAHYRGGDPSCPWYNGRTLHPEEVRALQYQGNQVSAAHVMLCSTIDRLVRLDSRYARSTVGKYLPPTESNFGRYPDIYVELDGLPPLSIEIQLSNTFQTEISSRCMHYEREGVALLWVFYGVDPVIDDLPQSFRDVIRRHRGNAFILDCEAIEASRREKTLVLKCYLKRTEDAYESPILIRIDELIFPTRGLPYFRDCIVEPLLNEIDDRRSLWFRALTNFPDAWHVSELQSSELDEALSSLGKFFPDLPLKPSKEKLAIVRLIALVFSMLSTANGKPRNYVTKDPNVRAMLNGQLNMRAEVRKYALVLEQVAARSKIADYVGKSVADHIRRAKTELGKSLCKIGEPEWKLIAYLVPEILDPIVREELRYFDALPAWAKSGSSGLHLTA